MARTGQGIAHFDLDSLSDEQLHELKAQVAAKIDQRIQTRLAEFRRQARDAGYELSLLKIGEELGRRGARFRDPAYSGTD